MTTLLCDRCGSPLELGKLRYVTKIEVYAAADPLEVSAADLAGDAQAEMEALLAQCEGMSEAELMRDVHVSFLFNLCRPCQREFLLNPLGGES